jgi:aspartyl-tRNA(Asn)/glutamyl-tRNA(Gln) amidotransferase subunit B
MTWEVVIGLETHAQLSTASKIFSGASTAFGAAPNTQASAVDIALPGVLPVLNRGAVERAIRFGLAVGGTISRKSVFARKNYFYPDLPKGYQISQYEVPVVQGGSLTIATSHGEHVVRLTRAHLEEDAGKSLHEDHPGMSGIDLNRAGTPLLEIVSEPDLRSAADAVTYARTLHALVRWIGICDGNMQEGSFRCDANVSVRRQGETKLGTRCEIKNLNSFRFMQHAIEFEVRRQIEWIEDGGTVVQETRLYDPDRGETRSMRSKEDAQDYRYFPRSRPAAARHRRGVDRARQSGACRAAAGDEGPLHRRVCAARAGRRRADGRSGDLPPTSRRPWNRWPETGRRAASSSPTGCWGARGGAQPRRQDDRRSAGSCRGLASLLRRVADGTISGKIGKEVFDAMWAGEHGGDADAIIAAQGLRQISDTGAIEKIVDDVLAANAAIVADFVRASRRPSIARRQGDGGNEGQGRSCPGERKH